MQRKEQKSILNIDKQRQHHVTRSRTTNTSSQRTLRIPRQLYSSRTGILRWISEQQSQHQIKGIRCFWIFLLTYMQVEHYDISFTRIQQQRIRRNKRQLLDKQNDNNNNQQQQQQKSQISSISSSVNIRQRKVSFGIIRPNIITSNINKQNDCGQTKRKRNIKNNNLFIVVGNNNGTNNNNNEEDIKVMSDQQLKRLSQRQMRLRSLLRKVKLLVYSFLEMKKKNNKVMVNEQQKYYKQQSRKLSVQVAKALSILFPSEQTKLKDILQYQNIQTNLIVQILSNNINKHQNNKQTSSTTTTRYLTNTLINTLEQATIEMILVNNNNSNSNNNSNNTHYQYQQTTYPINNITKLLQHFNFNSGQDYNLIHKQKQQQHKNQVIGIYILSGFFTILTNNSDGYLISIDVDKLYNVIGDNGDSKDKRVLVNDKVRSVVKQGLLLNSVQTQQRSITKQTIIISHYQNINRQQQGQQRKQGQQYKETNLSYKINLPNNTNFITTTTPTQFINRYNNRYFRNQRLLYKQQQKNKLQNRFRQQQQSPIDNIDANNNTNKNSDDGLKMIHHHQQQQQLQYKNNGQQYNGYKILVTKGNLMTAEHSNGGDQYQQQQQYQQQYQYQQQNQQYQQQSQLLVQDEINNLFGDDDDQQQQYKEQQQQSNRPQKMYQQQQHQQQQQLLNHFYSRHDFEISDNQILDDIQRVLLI